MASSPSVQYGNMSGPSWALRTGRMTGRVGQSLGILHSRVGVDLAVAGPLEAQRGGYGVGWCGEGSLTSELHGF